MTSYVKVSVTSLFCAKTVIIVIHIYRVLKNENILVCHSLFFTFSFCWLEERIFFKCYYHHNIVLYFSTHCTRVTQKGKKKSPLTLASATLPPSALALSCLRAVIMVAYCEVVCNFKMPDDIPCFQCFFTLFKIKVSASLRHSGLITVL